MRKVSKNANRKNNNALCRYNIRLFNKRNETLLPLIRVVPEYAEVPVSLPSHSLYEMKKKKHLLFAN